LLLEYHTEVDWRLRVATGVYQCYKCASGHGSHPLDAFPNSWPRRAADPRGSTIAARWSAV
jgi:hypothetical protein